LGGIRRRLPGCEISRVRQPGAIPISSPAAKSSVSSRNARSLPGAGSSQTDWKAVIDLDTLESFRYEEVIRQDALLRREDLKNGLAKQLREKGRAAEVDKMEEARWGAQLTIDAERTKEEEKQKQQRKAEEMHRFHLERNVLRDGQRRRRQEEKQVDVQMDQETQALLAEARRREAVVDDERKGKNRQADLDLMEHRRSIRANKPDVIAQQLQFDKATMRMQSDNLDKRERERREYYEKLRNMEPRTAPGREAVILQERADRTQKEEESIQRAQDQRMAKQDAEAEEKRAHLEHQTRLAGAIVRGQLEEKATKRRAELDADALLGQHFRNDAAAHEAEEQAKKTNKANLMRTNSALLQAQMGEHSPIVPGKHGHFHMNAPEKKINKNRLAKAENEISQGSLTRTLQKQAVASRKMLDAYKQ